MYFAEENRVIPQGDVQDSQKHMVCTNMCVYLEINFSNFIFHCILIYYFFPMKIKKQYQISVKKYMYTFYIYILYRKSVVNYMTKICSRKEHKKCIYIC
jgi:hypothetical protein